MNKAPGSDESGKSDVPAEPKAWGLVWTLAAAQLVSWGALYYSFSLFVVPMEAELGWSRTALNGALSLGLLANGLFAYPVGAWIDKHGGRLVMTLGSMLGAAMLALWSSVHALPVFYALWIGLGIALAATLYQPVFVVLTRLFVRTYRTKITTLTLVGGLASTVFIPLTQLLIDRLGWRHALLALALIVLAIGVPIHALVLRAEPPHRALLPADRNQSSRRDGPLRRALRSPVFWSLLMSFTAYEATFSAMTFHLVPMLTERGFATEIIVGALAVIGPAQVSGRLVLLGFGRHLSIASVGRVVILMFPASVVLLTLWPNSVATLFVFAAIYGAANGIMTIIRGTAVPELLWREGYGAIAGALSLPATMAKAVAPVAAALIWSASGGYTAVLWTIILGGLIAALGFWLAARLRVTPPPYPPALNG